MPDFFERRAVLVTGGAGAIGSNLVRHLAARGADVVVLDDLSSGFADNLSDVRCRLITGSVEDDAALNEAFRHAPRTVFHLAALFANQNSVDHPDRDLAVNGAGTLRLLMRAAERRVERLVYTSSSCVYGPESALPSREPEASLHAKTPYQATKLLGELYTNCFHALHGLPVVNTRLFNVYGPRERPGRYRNVIPNFIEAALDGAPLVVDADGAQTRDFTFVDDVVAGLCSCAQRPEAVGGTFNLGTGREVTIRALAELVVELTRSTSALETRPMRPWDVVSRRCADITAARRALGFEPRWAIREGLSATIEWFIAQREGARPAAGRMSR